MNLEFSIFRPQLGSFCEKKSPEEITNSMVKKKLHNRATVDT